MSGWGPFLASHGFVVMMIGTLNRTDVHSNNEMHLPFCETSTPEKTLRLPKSSTSAEWALRAGRRVVEVPNVLRFMSRHFEQ